MRKADIFDGLKIRTVSEGERFELVNQWPEEVGKYITLSMRAGVTVIAKVLDKNSRGTVCEVVEIGTVTMVEPEAEDEDFVDSLFDVVEPVIFKRKDSKKKILQLAEENSIKIDSKMTKREILEYIEGMEGVSVL